MSESSLDFYQKFWLRRSESGPGSADPYTSDLSLGLDLASKKIVSSGPVPDSGLKFLDPMSSNYQTLTRASVITQVSRFSIR